MSKTVSFIYSFGYWHLDIDGYHNPDVCPECLQIGTLGGDIKLEKLPKVKEDI